MTETTSTLVKAEAFRRDSTGEGGRKEGKRSIGSVGDLVDRSYKHKSLDSKKRTQIPVNLSVASSQKL